MSLAYDILAFGIFARSLPKTDEFASLIESSAGLELADSITGDGHKMLNVVSLIRFDRLCLNSNESEAL